MLKNGFAKSGKQKWRCLSCGSLETRRNDTASRWLKAFVRWLVGKLSQTELVQDARTFRQHTQNFWNIWPIPPVCDEVHHVVPMDSIWLACNKAVILIACTDNYVIGCHLAKTENSRAGDASCEGSLLLTCLFATGHAESGRSCGHVGLGSRCKGAPSMSFAQLKDVLRPGQRRKRGSICMHSPRTSCISKQTPRPRFGWRASRRDALAMRGSWKSARIQTSANTSTSASGRRDALSPSFATQGRCLLISKKV